MTHHMEYSWYSFDHLRWWLFVGLPILVVWVFGCPLVAFIILTKKRNDLDDWSVKKYFLVIYQGLRKETYYWEFVNTFRKFLILSISSLLNSYSINYRLMASIGIVPFLIYIVCLITLIRVQQVLNPYKLNENNQIELLGLTVGTVTMFWGFIFVTENVHMTFYQISAIIIFLVNSFFIIQWTYLLFVSVEWKNQHFQTFLKVYAYVLGKDYKKVGFSKELESDIGDKPKDKRKSILSDGGKNLK